MSHALFLYCDKNSNVGSAVKTDSFPLLVCIGREANYDGHVKNEIGPYHYGGCPMWNCARDFLGELAGKRRDLKEAIKRTAKSPVVHADISYKCLRDKEVKGRVRASLLSSRLTAHLKELVSQDLIWKRTRLVVFTGLSQNDRTLPESFFKSRCALEKMLRKKYKHIEFMDVPFFGRAKTRTFEGREIKSFPLPDIKTLASIVKRVKKYAPQTREARYICKEFLAYTKEQK